jgi:hypothetical protein
MALFNLLYNFVFKASTNGGALSKSEEWWDGVDIIWDGTNNIEI